MCRRLLCGATARSDRCVSRLPPAKLPGLLHDDPWIRGDDGDGPVAVLAYKPADNSTTFGKSYPGVRAGAAMTGGPLA